MEEEQAYPARVHLQYWNLKQLANSFVRAALGRTAVSARRGFKEKRLGLVPVGKMFISFKFILPILTKFCFMATRVLEYMTFDTSTLLPFAFNNESSI